MDSSRKSIKSSTTNSLTNRTLKGLFWVSSSFGLQTVFQIITLSILARLLQPADFGLVSVALVIVGFSQMFSQIGIGPALIQRKELELSHISTAFTASIIFGLLLAAVIFLLAPALAGFFKMQPLVKVVRVMSIIFLVNSVSIVAESLLKRELKFKVIAKVQVLSYTLGYGAFGISLAFLGYGVWALVIANLAQAFIKSVLLLFSQPHSKLLQWDRPAFNDLIYFGGGFTIARICNYIGREGDKMVVGRFLGAGALGLYGRAYQLMAVPATIIGQVLDDVLFPAMAKVQHQPDRLLKSYRRAIVLIALLILPTSGAMIFLAPEIIHLLLGQGWKEAIVPFQILVFGMMFRSGYKMADSLARATGAVYRRAWRQSVFAFWVVAGSWVGQHWGLSGVAVGILSALILNYSLMAHLSLKLVSMRWRTFLNLHIPALLVAAVLCLEMWILTEVLRTFLVPPITILGVSIVLSVSTIYLIIKISPQRVLGKDGVWMFQTLFEILPRKYTDFQWTQNIKKSIVGNYTV